MFKYIKGRCYIFAKASLQPHAQHARSSLLSGEECIPALIESRNPHQYRVYKNRPSTKVKKIFLNFFFFRLQEIIPLK